MKRRTLKFLSLGFALLWIAPIAQAKCSDYAPPSHFPQELVTERGARVTYSYQFENDETYTIYWEKGAVRGGPIGPASLQPGCQIPKLVMESDEFLLLEKACGGSCWYFDVLGLFPSGAGNAGSYEQVYQPLAFDEQRNLLAYYPRKDVIAIKNLLTGYVQEFPAARVCDTGSGPCFNDVRFTPDNLLYTWESVTGIGPGDVLSQRLDDALIRG